MTGTGNVIMYLQGFMPEVSTPTTTNLRGEEVLLRKIIFSIMCLFIYLVLSSVPVYGAFEMYSGHDPLYAQRLILSANRGSLLELGLSPIITASMFLQTLESAGIVGKYGEGDINSNDSSRRLTEREYRQKATKIAALLLSLLQAIMVVSSGVYGSIKMLGYGNAILIVLQLFLASWIVLLMDEAMEKGHGIGSGVTLFMCAHICTDVLWRSLCPFMVTNASGSHFVGILIAIPHILLTRRNLIMALHEIFFRDELSNLFGIVSMIIVGAFTLFVNTFSVDILLKGDKKRRSDTNNGVAEKFSIPLLYTSSMPVMLYFTSVGNFLFLSQILYVSYPRQAFIKMIGCWEQGRSRGQLIPTSGVAYLISPPSSITAALLDPFHFLFYIGFVLSACSMLSQMYVQITGNDAKHVTQQLTEQGYSLIGHRDSNMYKIFNKYIPIAASLGGIVIGAISLFADFTGSMVSGGGILIVTSTIHGYAQTIRAEKQLQKMGMKDIVTSLGAFLPFATGNHGGNKHDKII